MTGLTIWTNRHVMQTPLEKKLDELQVRICEDKPSIIIITEVKAKIFSYKINQPQIQNKYINWVNEHEIFSKKTRGRPWLRDLLVNVHKMLMAKEHTTNIRFYQFITVGRWKNEEMLVRVILKSPSDNTIEKHEILSFRSHEKIVWTRFNYGRLQLP